MICRRAKLFLGSVLPVAALALCIGLGKPAPAQSPTPADRTDQLPAARDAVTDNQSNAGGRSAIANGYSAERPKEMLIVTDSVVLGGVHVFRKNLPDWRIDVEGRSAFNLPAAIQTIRKRSRVPALVIVAVGHNTAWDKARRNFEFWSAKFDRDAEMLVTVLTERGADRILWVQLRELTLDLVPGKRKDEFERGWYFPYVNERLRALQLRRPAITLVDWTSGGRRQGLTYDSIHLNDKGAAVMLELLKMAIPIR